MLFIEMFVNKILDSRCSFNGDWITKKLGKWILFLQVGTVVRDVFVEMLLEIIEMSLSRSNIGWGTKNTFIQIKIFAFHYFLFLCVPSAYVLDVPFSIKYNGFCKIIIFFPFFSWHTDINSSVKRPESRSHQNLRQRKPWLCKYAQGRNICVSFI